MSRTVIAVASGKGGTGKTTIAVALARALADDGRPVTLLDADVEAPNAHLFLEPELAEGEIVTRPVPVVDQDACTGCGLCREVCAFSAVAMIAGRPLFFPEMCHGCGACSRFCPERAIREEPHPVGRIEGGRVDGIEFHHGRTDVGEPRSIPVISALRRRERSDGFTLIDAPPGTSCPVIAAVRGADLLLLVTEPTPFGRNDLELAVGVARELRLPCAVIINRADIGDEGVADYCRREAIPVVMKIPFDRHFAEAYARGGTLLEVRPELAADLRAIAAAAMGPA